MYTLIFVWAKICIKYKYQSVHDWRLELLPSLLFLPPQSLSLFPRSAFSSLPPSAQKLMMQDQKWLSVSGICPLSSALSLAKALTRKPAHRFIFERLCMTTSVAELYWAVIFNQVSSPCNYCSSIIQVQPHGRGFATGWQSSEFSGAIFRLNQCCSIPLPKNCPKARGLSVVKHL